jgi:hypothetical protein
MFFGKYLPPPSASGLAGQIPTSLVPPIPLSLTQDQQFFAGGWLSSFDLLQGDADCEATISWDTGSNSGTTIKP